MSNFIVDAGADNGEIVSTLNYLLSNLGSAPFGLTINKINGEILNVGTNTVTGYLYQYIRIGWANNIQGLYFSGTAAGQSYYGIYNNDDPTFPTTNTAFTWRAVNGNIGTSPNTYLWYSVQGGRQITFVFADSIPSSNFVKYTGAAINLDVITFVGNSSVIGNGVVIGSYATIGTHANIGDYWTAGNFGNIGSNLVVAGNAVIGTKATIGANLSIGSNATISTNLVVGANATIGANLSIGSNVYISGLVTNSVLDANTVNTTQLVNLSVTNGKLANNSVTTGKIANYTIIAQDIANATITTDQIADYTILGTNLANATIGSQQITNYSITGTDIANATITSDKLSVTALSDITANAGNITSGTITGAGSGGATIITGYTTGVLTGFSNVAIVNGSSTDLTTFTVSTPTPTRVMLAVTGSVAEWGFESNSSYYDSMSGNVVLELVYSNSTVRSTLVNLAQGTPTIIWRNATRYDYRIYLDESWVGSYVLAPDTYTVRMTPYWFYRSNTTGNLVTPSNESLTYTGRLATFQANIT